MSQYALSQYPLSHFDVYWLVLIKTGCPPTQNHFVFPGSAVLCIFAHYKTFRKLEILEFWKNLTIFSKKTFNIKKKLKIRFWKSQNVTIFLSSRTTNAKLINHIAGWPWFWLTNRLRLHPLCRNFGRKRFSFFTHRKNFIPVES